VDRFSKGNPLAAHRLMHYEIDMPKTAEEVKDFVKVIAMILALMENAIHEAMEKNGIDQSSSFLWLKDGQV